MPRFNPGAYRLTAAFVRGTLRLYYRIEIRNPEKVPREGAILLAANHGSYLDPLLVGAFSPRPVRFMMMKSYYEVPVLGFFYSLYGSFPVDEGGITRFTLRNCLEVLREGHALGIFPEGGRTRDGSLRPGKTGTMLLAMKQRAPVVPVGLVGAFESYPASRIMPRPGRISIRFGDPITDHLACIYPRDKKMLPELTDLLMARIRQLMQP